ncbi:MAG: hypothetical protein J6V62_02240 [Paludibacteraceae bacterium]|nr:hypothetical protein [Paludibacteraceae bacterium]
MKNNRDLHLEGAPIQLHGKAAQRFWRLVKNPKTATPEEKEKVFNAHKFLNLAGGCDLCQQ